MDHHRLTPVQSKTRSFCAFTLLEMLVAIVVLAIIALVLVGITESTLKATGLAQRRMAADSGSRQALDRIGIDFDQFVRRPDLPELIEKNSGNDRVTFFSQITGYGGNRGVSTIRYDVTSGILRRGALGTSWTGNFPAGLAFNTTNTATVSDDNFDVVASEVFRFEIAFLMADGSLVRQVNRLTASPGAPPSQTVSAVIVGLAAIDPKARQNLSAQDLETLSAVFTDAEDGKDLLQKWDQALQSSSVSLPTRSSVRVYQRYFYLPQ